MLSFYHHFGVWKMWARSAFSIIFSIIVLLSFTIFATANTNDACGNIKDGINEDQKIKYRSPFLEDLKDCKSCWVRYLCGGCCFAEKYAQNGKILKNIPEKCELEKTIWEKILILSQRIKESKPEFYNKLKKRYEV